MGDQLYRHEENVEPIEVDDNAEEAEVEMEPDLQETRPQRSESIKIARSRVVIIPEQM